MGSLGFYFHLIYIKRMLYVINGNHFWKVFVGKFNLQPLLKTQVTLKEMFKNKRKEWNKKENNSNILLSVLLELVEFTGNEYL